MLAILYPRETKIAKKCISVNWLKNIFPYAKFVFLDTASPAFSHLPEKILVSCHFENNYPYILQILEREGIKIKRNERKGKPKIFLGGPVAVNPFPLYEFIDVFFIGDFSTEVVKKVIEENAENEHVFIPGKKEYASVSDERELLYYAFCEGELHVEVQCGCRNRCLFCLLGWTKKLAYCDVKAACEVVSILKPEKVFLIGSDIFAHREIEKIVSFVKSAGIELSFPSSRLSEIVEYLHLIKEISPKTFTIAPESSERIRRALNKRFSNEEILQVAELLKQVGVKKLKLYFILGLPGEREEDMDEIVALIKKLRKIMQVSATFSIFVPKPHTPMQFAPFQNIRELERKNKLMKKWISKLTVKAHFTNPKKAFIQMLLSIGGKNISKLLARVYARGLNYSSWIKEAKRLGIDLKKYSEEKGFDYEFDFECINTGVSKKALWKIYQNYKKRVESL